MKKLEQALQHLQNHQKTGNYMDLYAGLKLAIEANKQEPQNIDPLVRAMTFTILEPLLLEVEIRLHEPESPEPKEKQKGQVIFVDFAKKKRMAA